MAYDLILWGATGFTGRLVAEYLRDHGPARLRWAVGGRSREKLDALRRDLHLDADAVVGDSHDRASLDALVRQTRVVATTVGPYTQYGTPLVAACAESGTHYCDLTGEPSWIRTTIDGFHERARETGARIVHCCGFDSIPSDLGNLLLQAHARQRHGTHCTEVRFLLAGSRGGVSGGTVASLLAVLEQARSSREVRRVLRDPYALNPPGRRDGPDVPDQQKPEWDPDFERWTAPFVMAPINTRVVRRSNALLGDPWGTDFRYSEALAMPNLAAAWGTTLAIGAFMAAAAARPTRKLLQKRVLPAPGEGPSREKRDAGFFKVKLVGWTARLPRARLLARVEAEQDPGYGATAKMLAESALCLAFDKLDAPGGVLTPASCMGLKLVDRLRAAGMKLTAEDWPPPS